jgi:membrane protein
MTATAASDKGATKTKQNGTSLFAMLKETVSDWSEDKAMKLSAALALYTILSLAPLMVVAIKILSMVLGEQGATDRVSEQMHMLIGSAGAQAVEDMIKGASKPGAGIVATAISLVILLFSASGVFGELQDSLNTIWEVKPKPNQGILATIKNRLFSMGMVFVVAFLLLVSLLVSTVLTTLTGWVLGDAAGWIAIPVDIVVSIVAVTLLIGAIFKFLPDVRLGWRDVIVGAFATAVLFKLGQYGLGLYFKYGSSTSAYGAAGSFVAVLLWVYYSAWILFFGAEFTQVWARHHGRQLVPTANAVRITEEDRAQRGIPSNERLEHKARQQQSPGKPGKDVPGPSKRPPALTSEWEVKEREWD